jgi:Raf kinase inhibitor-like YbhB/YbcL family protein
MERVNRDVLKRRLAPAAIGLAAMAAGTLLSCRNEENDMAKTMEVTKMQVTSTAFNDGGMIPQQYTCDGQDKSPPLNWGEAPDKTRSFALIADDPDAPGGTFVHWVLYGLPAEVHELPEGVPDNETLPSGARQGVTGFGAVGYGGPCPPSGTHRYFFKVYALDTELSLPPGRSKADLLKAMEGHVLAQGQIMGKYKRR